MLLAIVVLLSVLSRCSDASLHATRTSTAGESSARRCSLAFSAAPCPGLGRHGVEAETLALQCPTWRRGISLTRHADGLEDLFPLVPRHAPPLLVPRHAPLRHPLFPGRCAAPCPTTALRGTRTGQDFVDHYQVLGVTAAADQREIKRVFRELSRQYHPDLNKGTAEEYYRRITAAYNVLSDPERRASYNRKRMHVRSGSSTAKLLSAFETELQKLHTPGAEHDCDAFCSCGAGHVCSAFCSCGETAQEAPLNRNKMHRSHTKQDTTSSRTDGPSQQQDTVGNEFDDAGRVITPPSTYQELSVFMAQAKRASYSRPRIYTCNSCGGASASRDQCDLCGSMQTGQTHTTRNQDRVFPVYSMHKFGSHLNDDRRHELVHKNHISRSAPAHTRRRMLDDMTIPDEADIDTGAQRIWGQVSPSTEMPEAPFGTEFFEPGLDFYGITKDPPRAGRKKSAPQPQARTRVDADPGPRSGLNGSELKSVVVAEEAVSDPQQAAISDGCWVLGDMESELDKKRAREEQERAAQKSVLMKETQVAIWEAKVEQCKRELASLEEQLQQARAELVEAQAQQGWSGAGAVDMGGAGAVFRAEFKSPAAAGKRQELRKEAQVAKGKVETVAPRSVACRTGGCLEGLVGSESFQPRTICSTCGCHTAVGEVRCECCASPLAPPAAQAPEGKHAGLTKVFTMHKIGRTQLSEEVMHTLVHPHHHSDHHGEGMEPDLGAADI
jgi:curved DNA-binding protein CbpA